LSGPVNWMKSSGLQAVLLGNNSFSDYLGPWVCLPKVIDMTNTNLNCPGYCSCKSCTEYCINSSALPQTSALKDLYYSTRGSSWNSKENWLTGLPPCSFDPTTKTCNGNWDGISCVCEDYGFGDENFRVIGLLLGENNMAGSIPSEYIFKNLNFLTSLNLSVNSISGTIPFSELLALPDLDVLDLSHNMFEGKVDEHVCRVDVFDLRGNEFSCPLPKCCSSGGEREGLCVPCISILQSKSFYLGVSLGAVFLVLVVLVVVGVRRMRERKAFIEVEEEDELVSLLKPPVHEGSDPLEDPHSSLYWWRKTGTGLSFFSFFSFSLFSLSHFFFLLLFFLFSLFSLFSLFPLYLPLLLFLLFSSSSSLPPLLFLLFSTFSFYFNFTSFATYSILFFFPEILV